MYPRRHALINELHELIVKLRRSEAKFLQQLSARRSKLDAAGRMHWTDPLHQRISSLLRATRQELDNAQVELRRCLQNPRGAQK